MTATNVLVLCEGVTDETVTRRLLGWVGATAESIHVAAGKAALIQRIPRYLRVAHVKPCLVLVDLDRERCAPEALDALGIAPHPQLCVRFAVRKVEAWLLADREGLSRYLGVPLNRLPVRPDDEEDPLDTLIAAARRSRRRHVRENLVPRPGSGRRRGPGYASSMIEFVETRWNIEEAMSHSPSLRRAVECLRRLVQEGP